MIFKSGMSTDAAEPTAERRSLFWQWASAAAQTCGPQSGEGVVEPPSAPPPSCAPTGAPPPSAPPAAGEPMAQLAAALQAASVAAQALGSANAPPPPPADDGRLAQAQAEVQTREASLTAQLEARSALLAQQEQQLHDALVHSAALAASGPAAAALAPSFGMPPGFPPGMPPLAMPAVDPFGRPLHMPPMPPMAAQMPLGMPSPFGEPGGAKPPPPMPAAVSAAITAARRQGVGVGRSYGSAYAPYGSPYGTAYAPPPAPPAMYGSAYGPPPIPYAGLGGLGAPYYPRPGETFAAPLPPYAGSPLLGAPPYAASQFAHEGPTAPPDMPAAVAAAVASARGARGLGSLGPFVGGPLTSWERGSAAPTRLGYATSSGWAAEAAAEVDRARFEALMADAREVTNAYVTAQMRDDLGGAKKAAARPALLEQLVKESKPLKKGPPKRPKLVEEMVAAVKEGQPYTTLSETKWEPGTRWEAGKWSGPKTTWEEEAAALRGYRPHAQDGRGYGPAAATAAAAAAIDTPWMGGRIPAEWSEANWGGALAATDWQVHATAAGYPHSGYPGMAGFPGGAGGVPGEWAGSLGRTEPWQEEVNRTADAVARLTAKLADSLA